ncbi:TPA: ATP-binding cassette domain-containing protein, partial [Streptococcus pyogenes]|nr:ATP-binding cassette domain-containing protein [Streptococcus pyogenes]
MIKAQLKNLIKTIHLVKEAGFSLNGSLYMELLYDFTHDELVHNPIIESTVDTIQSVEFERVSFSYNGKDNVINDISFSIKAGERLAIVGGNGSGKSTIFKLACGLYDNY